MNKVLLIEDDLQMQMLISDYLDTYGFKVTAYAYPKEALEALSDTEFDIVVLDLMLPQMEGFDVYKAIKETKEIPVVISSARGDIGNKIMGFELGADDYLAKPYEPRELVLRLEAVLKRKQTGNVQSIGDFKIDIPRRMVKLEGYEIDFTKIEFDIFFYLIGQKGKVLSREQLIHAASLGVDTNNRTVDMHISNIRYKIGDDPKHPKYIKSVWGIGYRFL